LGRYEIEVGAYPTTQQGLDALVTDPGNVPDWPGRTLDADAVPQDQWGNDWQYRAPGTQNTDGYDLFSFGPDGKQGGGDDITNWTQGAS
ncbi:MAG: type II secretion system protein GspG, partial [Planctomycetota bacterium]